MLDVTDLRSSLDGDLLTPASPPYDMIRRPANPAYHDAHPALVVRCGSVPDVVKSVRFALENGSRVAIRGGGHCFAGRSSTDGILIDLAPMNAVSVAADGVATIGAGAVLGDVYGALHAEGRALPAGCGPTVGIAGLTLGGGIGLLGRAHGLTCDHLVSAEVVLADGTVVQCDDAREPDLFWALRGAGGGQFGVVTTLRFRTIAEPSMTRIDARWTGIAPDELISAWQAWAPDAPDELTATLTIAAEPGSSIVASLSGASTLGESETMARVQELAGRAGAAGGVEVLAGIPYHALKQTLADPRDSPVRPHRIRSEFFSGPIAPARVEALLAGLVEPAASGTRALTFTAMGGAYNRVAEDATAFAHRGQRFLLEHIGDPGDPWVDDSWDTAHPDASGRVYPNFPDPALDEWAAAYHAGNHSRLVAIKRAYDPGRLFDFAQAL